MGGRAVDCDGLDYESARTSGLRSSRANEWYAAPPGAISEQNRRFADRRTEKSSGWVAERSIATVLKTVEAAMLPGVRIPPHPPVISISSNLYEIYIKNPRILRGFYYFTDSGKPTVTAISAAFLGYLYPAQFCKVTGYGNIGGFCGT